jgi:predicted Zn-dependent protease with MMP-like domain
MNRQEFEDRVMQAVDALPPYFRTRLQNAEFIVEEWPDDDTLDLCDIDDPAELQGFYHGIPLTERSTHYGLVAPDTISIYRQPILRACRSDDEVQSTIITVVRHEVAHFFGISDDRLRQLGAY